jgi:hypothetical protein
MLEAMGRVAINRLEGLPSGLTFEKTTVRARRRYELADRQAMALFLIDTKCKRRRAEAMSPFAYPGDHALFEP